MPQEERTLWVLHQNLGRQLTKQQKGKLPLYKLNQVIYWVPLQLLDIFNYDYLLQGGSARELQHLQQIWKSGDFIEFDYGPIENLQFYHSVEPTGYNLSQISVPIILYFGETDAIATPEGVHDIYAHMLSTVRSVRRIASSKFNHFDFLLSSEVKTLVNDKLIELMEMFLAGKLPYIIEWGEGARVSTLAK